METEVVLLFSIAVGSLGVALFSAAKVDKMEKRINELEKSKLL